MSSFSSACKTIHASSSPSFIEHTCDSVGVILSQGGCLTHDQGQMLGMLGTELGLMEMSEVEYTHLQHLIQAHMEAQAAPPDGPDARSHPATLMGKDATGSTVISPFTTTQAIDLSTSTDEHCLVMPGEKTPASYGEVPGFVLARVRGEDSPTEPHDNSSTSSQKRSRSAARVCLEKRFNTMSADTPRQQDIQSAVLSNFLTMLQQSAEAQEAAIHPQIQKWMKTDRANPYEVSSPFVGGVFNPVTNMREQVISHIPHMVEPNKHQGLIIPKSFSFSFRPERVVTKAHYPSGISAEEQQLVNIENDVATPAAASRKHGSTHSSQPGKATPDSAGESGSSTRKRRRPHVSLSQRREKHNSKERERRKRIRLSCDELNMLVPFCESDTDKVTTLQWTTAFLRYINKMYGDTFKEEFQKAFTDEKGLFLKSSTSSGQDPIHREMDETLSIPLAVEQ
ncbi:transcription factor-like 5 protein isoform X2 [Siniperca chuatsi]|uniref:transcription factor-like 5 protein isoform X2 n=1 Tax=Siniperca chuatsi TaxID=119488 RepID=UPI001CE102A8|nr:transcription factor-like 5 protein isoform X2 [Siniperca chuatsi]